MHFRKPYVCSNQLDVERYCEQKDYSYLYVWTISKWQAKQKHGTDLENPDERR